MVVDGNCLQFKCHGEVSHIKSWMWGKMGADGALKFCKNVYVFKCTNIY